MRKYLIEMPEKLKEMKDEKQKIQEALEIKFGVIFPNSSVIRADILKKKYY